MMDEEIEMRDVGTGWVYFRRGWGLVLTFIFVGISTSGIGWDIVLPELTKHSWLEWLNVLFPTYEAFVLIGGSIVVTLGVLIGWKDFTSKRGSWRREMAVNYRNNPEWVGMREDLKEANKKIDKLEQKIEEFQDIFVNFVENYIKKAM
jgi:hypothetical protein